MVKSISEMFNQIYNRNKRIPIVEDFSPSGTTIVAGTLNRNATIPVRPEDDYIQVLAKRVH